MCISLLVGEEHKSTLRIFAIRCKCHSLQETFLSASQSIPVKWMQPLHSNYSQAVILYLLRMLSSSDRLLLLSLYLFFAKTLDLYTGCSLRMQAISKALNILVLRTRIKFYGEMLTINWKLANWADL